MALKRTLSVVVDAIVQVSGELAGFAVQLACCSTCRLLFGSLQSLPLWQESGLI